VADLVKRAVVDLHDPAIAVLGLAYKADVDDMRESPAFEVIRLL
jgi:UDP-N-acetyl-D-mannosaminuronic acid dehydrogenase